MTQKVACQAHRPALDANRAGSESAEEGLLAIGENRLYAYLYVISPHGYGAGFTINIRNPAVQKNPPIRGRICARRILRPDEN